MRSIAWLVAFLLASSAAAQCPERVVAWARRCEPTLEAQMCDEGVVVVRAHPDGAPPLAIELRSSPEGSFRRVGSIGLSPIAELADWSLAPAGWREAFERVARCPPPPFGAVGPRTHGEAGQSTRPPRIVGSPWRAAAGLMLLLVVLIDRRRLVGWARRPWTLLLIPPATLALRALFSDDAFFHQNGQGPIWIEMALCHASPYGPGQRELFGEIASLGGAAPDLAVFLAQSIFLSFGPLFAFLIVRAQGGSLPFAAAASAAVALDPLLARLAHSESYFASQSLLLAAAAAALSAGARGGRVRFGLAVLAAGLIAAQASRVHPVSWVPIALLPACVLVVPGRSTKRRAIETAIAALGIATVLVITSWPTLLAQYQGQLVAEWGDRTTERFAAPAVPWVALVVALVVVLVSRSRRRGLVRAGALFACVVAVDRVGSVAPWSEAVRAANAHLYAPLLAVAAASLARAHPRMRRVLVPAMIIVTLGVFAWRWRAWTELPSDALEERIALEWRARMRSDDTLVYVERAHDRVQHLPIYQCVAEHPRVVALRWPQAAPSEIVPSGALYVIETSLCATREGQEACERLRARWPLETLEERVLPARPSAPYQPYDVSQLRLRLARRR